MKHLTERKFILAALAIVIGAAMVFAGKLPGENWTLMAGGIVTGFYAVTGWATNRKSQAEEQYVQSLEHASDIKRSGTG